MICRKCGANIDTTIRAADGSVQCNACGTVYRPKAANVQPNFENKATIPVTSSVDEAKRGANQSQRHRRSTNTASNESFLKESADEKRKQSFLKNKFLSLPMWAWLCAILLIGVGAVAILSSSHDDIAANNQTTAQINTQNVSYDDPIIGRWFDGNNSVFGRFSAFSEFFDNGSYRNVFCSNDSNGYGEEEQTGSAYVWRNLGNNTYEIQSVDDSGKTETDTLTYSPENDELFLNGKSWGIRYFGDFYVISDSEFSYDNLDEYDPHVEFYEITSVIRPLKNERNLIKFDDYGSQRYGIISSDDFIIPLFVDQNDMSRLYIPDSKKASAVYSMDVLSNGDYYEQIHSSRLENGGIRIFSEGGEILYQTNSENGSEMVLGAYGDKIIVLHHIASFSENTWKLYTINHFGEKNGAEYDVSDKWSKYYEGEGLTDLGCGIFVKDSIDSIEPYRLGIYNLNTDSLYIINRWFELYPFSEESRTALWQAGLSPHYHYIVSVDCLSNESTYNAWFSSKQSIEEKVGATDDYGSLRSPKMKTYHNGTVYLNNGYYTLDGDFICSTSSLGNTKIIDIGWLDGGYAPIILQGADNYYYITVINENGASQYDPIRLKNYNSYINPSFKKGLYEQGSLHAYSVVFFEKGYVFYEADTGCYLITPHGEEITLQEGLRYSYGLQNGYIFFDKALINVQHPDVYIHDGYMD